MPWTWRDPLHGLSHSTSRITSRPLRDGVARVWYKTWCGLQLSVDDVNARTVAMRAPNCLGCVVAEPPPDVVAD